MTLPYLVEVEGGKPGADHQLYEQNLFPRPFSIFFVPILFLSSKNERARGHKCAHARAQMRLGQVAYVFTDNSLDPPTY